MWNPLIASIKLTGEGVGQLRTIELIDGKQIIDRLEFMDNSQRLFSLHESQRNSGRGLYGNAGRETQGERQFGRVARAVSGR